MNPELEKAKEDTRTFLLVMEALRAIHGSKGAVAPVAMATYIEALQLANPSVNLKAMRKRARAIAADLHRTQTFSPEAYA